MTTYPGNRARATTEFIRPADSSAIAAKDIVGVNITITAASNATPIVVTAAAHGLATGDPVTIASVGGNTAANANSFVNVLTSSTFELYSDRTLATAVAGNGAYTSGGTIAKPLRFKDITAEGNGGIIEKATIFTDQTTNTDTYILHLFNVAPAGILENAPCTAPLYTTLSGYVGTITFPAAKTEGASSTAAYATATPNTTGMPLPFVPAANSNDLFGLLECTTGFTPASGQKFTVILQTVGK